jgi:ubiquinone biosynthesis protein COQ9
MTQDTAPTREILLRAILPHVPFDGWSEVSFAAAVADLGLDAGHARALAPRGAIDLAVAYHRQADAAMVVAVAATDMSSLNFRDKVATTLRLRVEAMDNVEAVRRATALFSLPMNAPEGAGLVWETADHVWTALGDTSRDLNWYTKRATLSGVWASTVLYWLGDTSPGHVETHAFIYRRIEDVMRIEKLKAGFRENPLTKPIASAASTLFSRVRAPDKSHLADLPGRWSPPGG